MNINAIQLRFAKPIITCSLFLCFFFSNAVTVNQEKRMMLKNDPVPAQKVITQFLQWYKINLHKANSFPLLKKDSAGNYMVNRKAVTGYLNFIKSSKCISPRYIAHWQTYFDDKATELKEHLLQSDMPEGFDFDFVLITQEPELVLNKISSLKFKTVSMNKSVALIGVTLLSDSSVQYEYELYKGKKGWQIGYISTPNYD
ncbi:MAG: hypothetical protein WKI04_04380 [Ferruginibacter sp.]